MCYSAKVRAEYREYVKEFGAILSLDQYVAEYWEQMGDEWIKKMPSAIRAWFRGPGTEAKAQIGQAIEDWTARQIPEYEAELAKQLARLEENERKLTKKITKTAQEEVRKATAKAESAAQMLKLLTKPSAAAETARIFPQSTAPIMVWENGRRVVRMMRFQCRKAGAPSSSDWVIDRVTKQKRMSGTYNARRDNLERFWRKQFGYSHGIVVADTFFEHVWRHNMEGRELRPGEKREDVILEFVPDTGKTMLIACIWSHWDGASAGEPSEPDLQSFAFITDDPPPEVAAAGHDRCVIPIRPENVDAWLQPDPENLAAMHAILDDRERPYYEHQFAAAA